jgi:hypothetical protein
VIRTVEGVIDEHGNVRLLEPIRLPSVRRALVTILEDRPARRPTSKLRCSANPRWQRTGAVRRRTRRGPS